MKAPNPVNAVKSACRVAKRKLAGKSVLLDQETVDERLTACASCPFFDSSVRQCQVCTCFVDLKAQLATEKCPKGRWPITNC